MSSTRLTNVSSANVTTICLRQSYAHDSRKRWLWYLFLLAQPFRSAQVVHVLGRQEWRGILHFMRTGMSSSTDMQIDR